MDTRDSNGDNILSAAFFSIEIGVAITVAVAAIISSSIACKAVCCRKSRGSGDPIIYSANGLQGQHVPLDKLIAGFSTGSSLPVGLGMSTNCN